jgi:predicted acylesterase/phospholipase RssA
MKVIDAVCMSMAIPLIFACGKYEGKTYVDGGTQEIYPLSPFLDKKPYEITCVKLKMDKIYQEEINTPRQFVESLVRATIVNRSEHNKDLHLVEIDIGETNVFDFSMSYEDKIRLYNLGYKTIK